jgi:hypothetical protein
MKEFKNIIEDIPEDPKKPMPDYLKELRHQREELQKKGVKVKLEKWEKYSKDFSLSNN